MRLFAKGFKISDLRYLRFQIVCSSTIVDISASNELQKLKSEILNLKSREGGGL